MGLLEDISRRMTGWNPGMVESPPSDDGETNPLMMLARRAGLLAPAAAPIIAPGAVPLPVPRPASAPAPMATDISAASRQPMEAPAPSPEPSMFGRLGGGLMDGLERNSNALLAVGAGFAGAPNIGQAISRASAAAIPAHAADVKQRLTQQAQTYGTKALVEAGVPIQQAIAAQGDPDLKRALIQNYIVDRKAELKEIGVDAYGNKRFGVFDPFSKEIKPVKTGYEGADNASTVDALVEAGVPKNLAMAAQRSPEIMRSVTANYLNDRKGELKQIGTDQYGQPKFGIFDPYSKKIEPVSGTEGADNAAAVNALVEAGVPRNLAVAAQRNPAIMQSVTSNYLSDRKGELKEIGVDRYGNKIMGIFDPFTKKITPVATGLENPGMITAAGGDQNAPAPVGGATDVSGQTRTTSPLSGPVTAENDITGPDYLDRLKEADPAYARQVEAVINGDAPFPTGKQAQTPLGRRISQDVLTVEPGASASDFATRQGVRKDYASGNAAKVTKAINTAITHGAGLEKATADLKNFSTMPGFLNPVTGFVQKQFDKDYQKARKEFEVNAENYVRELDFAISGGRPTVSGAAHQRSAFDINASPEENMASLRKSIELLKGRLDSHAEGFNKGMKTSREGVDFVDPPNRAVYKKLLGETNSHGGGAPAAALPVGKSTVINGVTIKRLD